MCACVYVRVCVRGNACKHMIVNVAECSGTGMVTCRNANMHTSAHTHAPHSQHAGSSCTW